MRVCLDVASDRILRGGPDDPTDGTLGRARHIVVPMVLVETFNGLDAMARD